MPQMIANDFVDYKFCNKLIKKSEMSSCKLNLTKKRFVKHLSFYIIIRVLVNLTMKNLEN